MLSFKEKAKSINSAGDDVSYGILDVEDDTSAPITFLKYEADLCDEQGQPIDSDWIDRHFSECSWLDRTSGRYLDPPILAASGSCMEQLKAMINGNEGQEERITKTEVREAADIRSLNDAIERTLVELESRYQALSKAMETRI